jgi:hypothetical protein
MLVEERSGEMLVEGVFLVVRVKLGLAFQKITICRACKTGFGVSKNYTPAGWRVWARIPSCGRLQILQSLHLAVPLKSWSLQSPRPSRSLRSTLDVYVQTDICPMRKRLETRKGGDSSDTAAPYDLGSLEDSAILV